ncbi:PQQ-like beta-propeller repeat protein, partial [candidate division KSB1 bacterium]|nr:PQQ-like beta-propeller repeat protein [candidate division KSB1 bacterium]
DAKTGKTVWTCNGNGDKPAYCSPVVVKHGQLNLLLTMTQQNIIGVNADNGKFLWQYRHVTEWDINPNTPLYHKGEIFCTSGYGTGSVLLKLSDDGKSVKLLWKNEELDSQFGAAVLFDGYIYGSGHKNRGWKCLDWKTGELKYSSRDLGGKGNVIFADGLLYCYSERGDLALVKPNPESFDVVSQFKITLGSGEHWAHPVIKDGRLYVRHGDVLMVYKISR